MSLIGLACPCEDSPPPRPRGAGHLPPGPGGVESLELRRAQEGRRGAAARAEVREQRVRPR